MPDRDEPMLHVVNPFPSPITDDIEMVGTLQPDQQVPEGHHAVVTWTFGPAGPPMNQDMPAAHTETVQAGEIVPTEPRGGEWEGYRFQRAVLFRVRRKGEK